jgi:hypothetical protein
MSVMGRVNPAVFLADANTSLPSKIGGIAFAVLEKGLYTLLMAFIIKHQRPNELNDINCI